ncbi:magnesium transporter NIPA-domain-containing protein [Glomus cerebriforme]|uniref:Magnesium transporter NIPA-domain-containing protein n=1 Tax=Glomus cerebriforme TaxID=658196 RepID=A0A397TG54_9GLOM|nr:magnesium transporter NIPA-domain-containing protein [Glomus cerebriforme]
MYKSNIFALIFLLLSSQILLVSSQLITNGSQIDNRSCNIDSDCINNPSIYDNNLRLGNFMCIQNKCKFVVASAQQCRDATDCVAYHYSNLYNISLGSDICSPTNCNIESKCDGAWDQKDITSIPQIGDQSSCCIGLPKDSVCDIVANNVDPCISGSNCHYDHVIKKCAEINENQKKYIWIGVLICLIGSTTLNIGLNVQKYAFTKHQEETDKQQLANTIGDDNNSIKNSTNNLEPSTLYRKLEKFMFWKQIIVSPMWVFGFAIYVVGSLLTFVALQFAPQSLIAPLGAVSLVVNLLIAPILHKQKLTPWDIVGVIIIIIGSVVITVFSGIVMQDYKLCVLIELFKRPQTITYLSVIGVFIFSLFTFIRVVERNAIQKDEEALANAIAVTVELAEQEKTDTGNNSDHVNKNEDSHRLSIIDENGKENIDQTLSTTTEPSTIEKDSSSKKTTRDVASSEGNSLEDEIFSMPLPRTSITSIRTARSVVVREHDIKEKVLLPLAYAILASSMATITTLFAKSLINLLTVSIVHQDNQFKDLLSWAILFITISTAIGQVYWISMGLKKYDALLQVPIFYCNWSLFDIIGGGVYYDEFRNFQSTTYVGFILGVSLIFFGVSLLSKRLAKLTKEEEKLKEIQKKWEQEMKKKKMNKNDDRKRRTLTKS